MRALIRSVLVVVLFAVPAFAQQLGDEKMKRANKAASTVVRERMAQERPADAKLLENVESADIVVVSGEYDSLSRSRSSSSTRSSC